MQQKLSNHIQENFPFLKEKKLLIATSGGIDSVVLLHLLKSLNFDISLAHCNFKLRGIESDKDEIFVKELGVKLNLHTITKSFNTEEFATKKQLSIQVAARNLRYNWFQEIVGKQNFDFVLTAHHADDNLETFLINLTRGTGVEGLTGIPKLNNNIARPLLVFSRDQIEKYATKNNIDWREDKSNASNKYVRNKIRNQIIPLLKEINPFLLDSFQKTTNYLQESKQLMDATVVDFKKKATIKTEKEGFKINIAEIQKTNNPKAYLYQLLNEFGFTEWNDITHLLSAQSGKEVISKTHRLLKDRDFLILSKKANIVSNAMKIFHVHEKEIEITEPLHLTFKEVRKKSIADKNTIYVTKEDITFPITLRKWQHGDSFYPSGMQGKKKLSKYFKDEKLSLIEKEQTWLLCNADNKIIWIVGKRQDNRFLAKKNTILLKISSQ